MIRSGPQRRGTSVRIHFKRLLQDQSAATAVEYAIIVAAIASVIAAVVFGLGLHVKTQYDDMQKSMP